MTIISYRELEATDAEALANVRLNTLITDPHSFTVTEEEERNNSTDSASAGLNYYATRNDACAIGAWKKSLVGVIGVERYRGQIESHKARIWGPYVLSQHRNHGIGSQLLASAIAYCRTIGDNSVEAGGVSIVCLETSAASKNAISLFQSAGFAVAGTEENALKFGDEYLAVIRMQLTL